MSAPWILLLILEKTANTFVNNFKETGRDANSLFVLLNFSHALEIISTGAPPCPRPKSCLDHPHPLSGLSQNRQTFNLVEFKVCRFSDSQTARRDTLPPSLWPEATRSGYGNGLLPSWKWSLTLWKRTILPPPSRALSKWSLTKLEVVSHTMDMDHPHPLSGTMEMVSYTMEMVHLSLLSGTIEMVSYQV